MKANQDKFKMSSEKFIWYKEEINRLKEIDKQITLKVQHQLNVMENRNKYFLRSPVEYQLQLLIDSFAEMSKEYKKNNVGIAYKICSDQLQNIKTEIIRDDNHQIQVLKNAENIKMFEVISDKIIKK